MKMIQDEYGWRAPPCMGIRAHRHYETEAEAQEAYDKIEKRLVRSIEFEGTTYTIGDIVVLYGTSAYDSPVPFAVCSHIWAIDPGDLDEYDPVLVVWDETAHDYDAGTMLGKPSGMLQLFGLKTKAFPADDGYHHVVEVVHHVDQGPDVMVSSESKGWFPGTSIIDMIEDVDNDFPFGLVAALTVQIDGRLYKLGDCSGPEEPDDLYKMIWTALGMTEDEWNEWSEG